jgi:peptide/nickel transport system substrate-binding protein
LIGTAVAIAAALFLSACSASSGGSGDGTVLQMAASADGPFTQQFNPLLPAPQVASGYSWEMMYEPLMMNDIAHDQARPWLAQSYAWSNGGKTLTIKLRDGIKWSNGQPMTAADVAFTFTVLQKNKALNFYGLPLAGATAPSADTAVVTFTKPAYQYLWWNTYPVPEAQWKSVTDPVKYTNPKPVATGPYVLKSFTSQVITLERNPYYWGSKPTVPTVRFVAYDSDNSMISALEAGQVDWITTSSDPRPIAQRDPTKIGYWATSPSTAQIFLYPNDNSYPTNQAPVRLALSKAIDRPAISRLVFNGYNPAIQSPTGLDPATQGKYIAARYQSLRIGGADPNGAKQTLIAAGYKLGGDGIFTTPQGNELRLTLTVPSTNPYGDWVRAAQVMAGQLKAAGIGVTVQTESQPAWRTDTELGHYQLTLRALGGVIPVYDLYNRIFAQSVAPVGTVAKTNYERYTDPSAGALLRNLADAAPGSPEETAALAGLQKLMVEQTPIVPLFHITGIGMWRTDRFTGWPSQANPYAVSIGNHVNAEEVVSALKPAGK